MPYLNIWALAFGAATIGSLLFALTALLVLPGYFAALYGSNLAIVQAVVQETVLASLGIGALTGVPLALAARRGTHPPLNADDVRKPLALLYASAGTAALLFGAGMFLASRQGVFALNPTLLYRWPIEYHAAHAALETAYSTAASVVLLGNIVLCLWVWRQRQAPRQPTAHTQPARPGWLSRSLAALGLLLFFTLCGGLQYVGHSMVGIGNFYYNVQADLLVSIPPEAHRQAETLTIHSNNADGVYYALRGPNTFQRTSNPEALPFGYTSQQLDAATQQHFSRLQQAWCTERPLFPELAADVPHYFFILSCREVSPDNISGAIPIDELPAELQLILDAIPSPQHPRHGDLSP